MEENENNVQNVESNNTVDSTATNETVAENNPINEGEKKSFVETLKAKKSLIVGLVIAIIAILIVLDILIRSPKETVKKYMSLLNAAHSKRADKLYDYAGSHVFAGLDDDEYDDFWDEYKEYTKSDEWDEYKDDLKERHDDDYYEDSDDDIKDSDTKVKVKKINSVKKVGSHLYCVKAQIQSKGPDDDKPKKKTVKYYVMKKGLKSYIVGME